MDLLGNDTGDGGSQVEPLENSPITNIIESFSKLTINSNLSNITVSHLKKLLVRVIAKRNDLSKAIKSDKLSIYEYDKLIHDRIHYNKLLKKIRYHINKPRKPILSIKTLDNSILNLESQISQMVNQQRSLTATIKQCKARQHLCNNVDELNDLYTQRVAVRNKLAKTRRRLKDAKNKRCRFCVVENQNPI